MNSILIRHRVNDFAAWKGGFDAHAGDRAAAGLTTRGVWRSEADSNEVVMVLDAGDVAKAKEFLGSDNLKQAMAAAGVTGRPDITFLGKA